MPVSGIRAATSMRMGMSADMPVCNLGMSVGEIRRANAFVSICWSLYVSAGVSVAMIAM